MSDTLLVRMLSLCAVLGGALRIASAFGPWGATALQMEVLYGVNDLLLLFGLMGIYFRSNEALGLVGFLGFIGAASGLALITGPDGMAFGYDIYQVGVVVISVSLALLGFSIAFADGGLPIVGICWVGSLAVEFAAQSLNYTEFGFFMGGILFGLGFVVAGIATFRAAAI